MGGWHHVALPHTVIGRNWSTTKSNPADTSAQVWPLRMATGVLATTTVPVKSWLLRSCRLWWGCRNRQSTAPGTYMAPAQRKGELVVMLIVMVVGSVATTNSVRL